jgi:hypothetical protein
MLRPAKLEQVRALAVQMAPALARQATTGLDTEDARARNERRKQRNSDPDRIERQLRTMMPSLVVAKLSSEVRLTDAPASVAASLRSSESVPSALDTSRRTRPSSSWTRDEVSSLVAIHPLNKLLYLLAHARRRGVEPWAVPRQHPLEVERQKPIHRPGLLSPRVPANRRRRVERVAVAPAPDVIAREEEAFPIEECHAAARMAGDRDGKQVGRELDRVVALEARFHVPGPGIEIRHMKDALATEAPRKLGMVGHVVAVREDHSSDAPECLEPIHERTPCPRRINEQIALVALDEIARRAERALGGIPAVVDAPVDEVGQRRHCVYETNLADAADRARRTRHDRHPGSQRLIGRGRLPPHDGLAEPLGAREDPWCEDAACLAVDARIVDEQVAGYVVDRTGR